MVMRPLPPVRGWEPWRRRRFRWLRKRFGMWLDRRECKDNGHRPMIMRLRRTESRFSVELTVCKSCHQVIDATGRRDRA